MSRRCMAMNKARMDAKEKEYALRKQVYIFVMSLIIDAARKKKNGTICSTTILNNSWRKWEA